MSPVRDPKTLIRHTAFRVEAAQGALRRPTSERLALLPLEFIHAFHVTLVEQFGDTAADVLYRSGYEWGLQEMLTRHQQLRDEIGGAQFDLWQMDAKFVLDAWWSPLAEVGWGACTFHPVPSRGVVTIELQHSLVAATLKPADEPVCHFYAGLFAGAVSFFDRQERHTVELQCAAVTGAVCRFLVAAGADIDSAETWRQQGIAPDEILRRFR